MVCPYRVCMTAGSLIISMFWIHKATAPHAAIVQAAPGAKTKLGVDGMPVEQPPPARKWTRATVLLAVCLVLLHIDLLVTGHLRAAVKGFLARR